MNRRIFLKTLFSLPFGYLIAWMFYWRLYWPFQDAQLAEKRFEVIQKQEFREKAKPSPVSNPLPIFIAEEHHQVFMPWIQLYEKGIRGKTLIHIDAHPDLSAPMKGDWQFLSKNKSDRPFSEHRNLYQKNLRIDNFIIPAIYMGLIREVIHVVPCWGDYPNYRSSSYWIEIASQSQGFRTRCPRYPYLGITDRKRKIKGPWEPFAQKKDTIAFKLKVCRMNQIPFFKNSVLLDIDLDTFSCLNPYASAHPETIGLMPEHRSNKKEIQKEISILNEQLSKKNIKPCAITAARSVSSGFTPVEQIEGIEQGVLKMISKLYGGIISKAIL